MLRIQTGYSYSAYYIELIVWYMEKGIKTL